MKRINFPSSHRASTQQGMALLVVLLMLALMALLAAAISDRWFNSFQRTLYQQQQLQGRWYALGMESVAIAVLQQDARDDPDHTHLAQYWTNVGQVFPLENAEIRSDIRDAQACFNLNAINSLPDKDQTVMGYPAQVFKTLLMNLTLEQGQIDDYQAGNLTAALQDWIDTASQPRPQGAKDDYYAAMTPPYLTAGQPLQDISELRLIRGFTPALIQQLRPLVCVLPEDELHININTLKPEQAVLFNALTLNQLSIDSAREILTQRPPAGWNSINDLLKLPDLDSRQALLPTELNSVLSVNSNYFTMRILVTSEDGRYAMSNLLKRTNTQVSVVYRQTDIQGE